MKKVQIILIILLAIQFNGKTATSDVNKNLVIEQAVINTDSDTSEDSTKAITKTVIIEEEENGDLPNSRNKWITAALAALGVVLVIVFRMLRKKKSG